MKVSHHLFSDVGNDLVSMSVLFAVAFNAWDFQQESVFRFIFLYVRQIQGVPKKNERKVN